QNTATAFLYRKYPQGLPSQSHNDRQQKPRNDSH
ncbi:putative transposase, partial [Escherichia coli 7-233-03_S4_C2]